ncbi:MAG: ABC transporter permease [Fibrobacterota bacterium]|nr:ABC transporter permease [Chitinispirillaceae bacterium]
MAEKAKGEFYKSSIFWALLALGLLLLFNLAATPGFFKIEIKDGHLYGSLIDILNRSSSLIIIAIGMSLVIATKGIDISVGSTVAITGAMAALLIGGNLQIVDGVQTFSTNVPMVVAILGALLLATAIGLWNGVLIAKIGMQPIIATLILMVAGRGIAQLLTNGQIITIYYKPYFFIGNGFLLGLPFSIYLVLIVLAATLLFTRKTALGLYIESVGINPVASRVTGIDEKKILLFVYAFCGFCAGIAGLIVSSNVKCADGINAGEMFELDAILAVAIGGTSIAGGKFFLVGSVVGALLIQTLKTTIYSIGVPPEINLIIEAIVVFIVMNIQSPQFRKMVFRMKTAKE